MQNTTPMNRSIELFCGTDGLVLGLQNASFQHTAPCEWDKDSCNNIGADTVTGLDGISDWNAYQSGVKTVPYDGLTGKIDMISGGPPCQPFSLGEKAQAYGDRRDMFPEAVRAVREVMPRVFIFEDVKDLSWKSFSLYFSYTTLQLTYPSVVKPQGMTWEEHCTLLEQHHTSSRHGDCKYNVVFRLLDAASYSIPQLRHQVVIVGSRRDVGTHWSLPNPTRSREVLLYSRWVTGDYWVRHNMAMPMNNPFNKQTIKDIRSAVEECNASLRPWQTTKDVIDDSPDPRSKEAAVSDNHVFRAGVKIYPGHSGDALDGPSKTIEAGMHGVPGGEDMFVLDNGDVRYYTVRESTCIQTFPDDYHFIALWTEGMRQIGSAAPTKLAEAVGGSAHAHLEEIDHAKRRYSNN